MHISLTQNLAMFFCAFLKEHGALMEKQVGWQIGGVNFIFLPTVFS